MQWDLDNSHMQFKSILLKILTEKICQTDSRKVYCDNGSESSRILTVKCTLGQYYDCNHNKSHNKSASDEEKCLYSGQDCKLFYSIRLKPVNLDYAYIWPDIQRFNSIFDFVKAFIWMRSVMCTKQQYYSSYGMK